jgi:sialate O-acetylesterase
MKRVPELAEALESNREAALEYARAMAARRKALETDPGRGWEREDTADADWKRISEPGVWDGELAELDGSVWYRAKVLLTETQAKAQATLNLGTIDDDDETWVNGIRVGGTQGPNGARTYGVPAGVLKGGFNTVTVRILDTGGQGGFTNAKAINLEVGEAVEEWWVNVQNFPGSVSPSRRVVPGAKIPLTNWRYKVGVDLREQPMPTNSGKAASTLYNGMIAPLIPYAIRGAIWYQGESNVSRAFQYRTSFPNMIKNWREDWAQGDFPFYFVQIAPFTYNAKDASAELREAQTLTAKLTPNTGQALAVDIVPNLRDIHPPMKQEVGDRLARLALNLTYGKRDVACFGPSYVSHKISGKEVRVKLAHADGMMIKGDKLEGIEVCGEDKVFTPAMAKIEGDTLVVWSDAIEKPLAARFGWRDAVVTNLFNAAGLPAGPFRTDNWPGITEGVKW